VKLPWTTGARPDQINRTFSPIESNCFRLPERNPSPNPTSRSREPTPHAMPNMVRNERSLCAQRVCRVWPKMSKITRTLHYRGLSRGSTPIVRRTRARGENPSNPGQPPVCRRQKPKAPRWAANFRSERRASRLFSTR